MKTEEQAAQSRRAARQAVVVCGVGFYALVALAWLTNRVIEWHAAVAAEPVAISTPSVTNVEAIRFEDRGRVVAALEYDGRAKVCRQTGSIEAAFLVMQDGFYRVAEERDRLRWGDKQVDAWKAERARDNNHDKEKTP